MLFNKSLKTTCWLLFFFIPTILFSQSKSFAKNNIFFNNNKLGYAKYQKNFCGTNNVCSYTIKDNQGQIQILVLYRNGWFISPKTQQDSLASVDFTEIIFINTWQKAQILGINKSENFLAKILEPFFGYQYTKYGGSFYLNQDIINNFIENNVAKYTHITNN